MPEVRLVGEDGKQIGVIKTADALAYAQERDLDLVEVAPEARPPVCRALDYSKYKYEQAQKLKAARKHQQQITIREIKFRPKIAQNDYDTKKGHVRRFLVGRDRVKVTIMFRGREVTHPERGTSLLKRLAEELADVGVVEQTPLQDGRNMTMMLAPSKSVLAGEKDPTKPGEESQAAPETTPASEAIVAPALEVTATPASEAIVAPASEVTATPASEAIVAPALEATANPASEAIVAPALEATATPPSEATAAPASEATVAPAREAIVTPEATAPPAADASTYVPPTSATEAKSNGLGDGPHNGAADTASPTPSDAAA